MNSEEQKPVPGTTSVSPVTTTPEPSVAEKKDDLHEVKTFIRERGLRMAITIGIGLIVIIAIMLYRSNQRAQIDRSAAMLMTAQNIQTLQDLIKQYPNTPSAPIALLITARTYYDGGNYAMADSAYADFVMKYPQHFMLSGAKLGRIHCLEAMGQLDQALMGYGDFIKSSSTNYLYPLAVFGKARCFTLLGRLAEARSTYEDFIATHPDSVWIKEAEDGIASIERMPPAPAPMPLSAPSLTLPKFPPAAK